MAIKAVFFDIDGTFLNDRKRVSSSTKKAISQMKEDGILVGLATGRGPGFVQPFMDNLGLDFAVTYNGQYILTHDKVLYQNQLPKSTVYNLIRYATKHRREISLGTSTGLVGSNIISMGTSKFGQIVSRIVPKSWAKLVERSFKSLIRRFKPQSIETLKTIMRETEDIEEKFPHVKITRSSPYSADIISADQSKLKGIAHLGEVFGFELSEVMAFGDSENDLEMLSGVGIGVAMGNGEDELKDQATHVTDTNNQNGIAKALSHYGLIHFETENSFTSDDDNFNKVKDFHHLMDGSTNDMPRVYGIEEASHRADFKLEEIVEFLYASSGGDKRVFGQAVLDLHAALDKAALKVSSKEHSESTMVGQVDALTDLLYLTYGSFVLMGVDPKPFFDTVHEANMGKIFPDGKAHFDPVTHKILKPSDWEERFAPEPHIKRELDRQIQKSLQRNR